MSNKVDQHRQRAIAELLGDVRDLKNASNKSHKSLILEKFIYDKPIFGTKGDSLLQVLIQHENPSNGGECETSLWADAPDVPSITATESEPRGRPIPANVPKSAAPQNARLLPQDSMRDSSRGIRRKESMFEPSSIKPVPATTMQTPGRSDGRSDGRSEAVPDQRSDNRGLGRFLLKWLLSHPVFKLYFTRKPEAPAGQTEMLETLPLYFAIEKNNLAFLACFIGIYCDPKCKGLRTTISNIIEAKTKDRLGDGNCIHAAIRKCIPFTSCLVAVCSDAALMDKDISKYTPMHRAIVRDNPRSTWIPPAPAIFKQLTKPPPWEKTFEPESIFSAIKNRDGSAKLLRYLLTSVNDAGNSPLQDRLSLKKVDSRLADQLKATIFRSVESIADVSTALYGTTGATKELYLNMADFNQASHNFHGFVEKLTQSSRPRTVQYSDATMDVAFSDTYRPAASSASAPASPESVSVNFEEILFFVHLPDLNYVKQPCPHSAISKLFLWLKESGVHTIRKLRIPDSTQNPLSEAFVQKYILDLFHIESLDWRKLDIDIDVLLRCAAGDGRTGRGPKALDVVNAQNVLESLTLYSSGSWSTLYHWHSNDGLVKFPNLRNVQINIVQLNQTEDFYDGATHKRHLELSNLYASRLRKKFAALGSEPELAYVKDWQVKTDCNWDYPLPPHEPEEPSSQVVKHQFTSQLLPSVIALQQLEVDQPKLLFSEMSDDEFSLENESGDDEYNEDDDGFLSVDRWSEPRERFQSFAMAPEMSRQGDRRIRVAIIDNGADRVRSRFRNQIAKGQSFVSVDELHSDQPLPWWMVSDAHGTQMASLVSQTNPYCRLYIARVGTRRNDIRAESAVKAINWAMEHNVDIISMSWTLDYDDPGLRTAIENAAARRILLFASTPDEGVFSEAWPAEYAQHTISVSATDQYGHQTTKRGPKTADVQIPGENIRAAGPGYIGNTSLLVSGSSVATALAAGLASLALLLMRTFNDDLPMSRPGSLADAAAGTDADAKHNRHFYYTKEGMLSVFKRMAASTDQAILLRHMFPSETVPKDQVLKKLAEHWNTKEWTKRRAVPETMRSAGY